MSRRIIQTADQFNPYDRDIDARGELTVTIRPKSAEELLSELRDLDDKLDNRCRVKLLLSDMRWHNTVAATEEAEAETKEATSDGAAGAGTDKKSPIVELEQRLQKLRQVTAYELPANFSALDETLQTIFLKPVIKHAMHFEHLALDGLNFNTPHAETLCEALNKVPSGLSLDYLSLAHCQLGNNLTTASFFSSVIPKFSHLSRLNLAHNPSLAHNHMAVWDGLSKLNIHSLDLTGSLYPYPSEAKAADESDDEDGSSHRLSPAMVEDTSSDPAQLNRGLVRFAQFLEARNQALNELRHLNLSRNQLGAANEDTLLKIAHCLSPERNPVLETLSLRFCSLHTLAGLRFLRVLMGYNAKLPSLEALSLRSSPTRRPSLWRPGRRSTGHRPNPSRTARLLELDLHGNHLGTKDAITEPNQFTEAEPLIVDAKWLKPRRTSGTLLDEAELLRRLTAALRDISEETDADGATEAAIRFDEQDFRKITLTLLLLACFQPDVALQALDLGGNGLGRLFDRTNRLDAFLLLELHEHVVAPTYLLKLNLSQNVLSPEPNGLAALLIESFDPLSDTGDDFHLAMHEPSPRALQRLDLRDNSLSEDGPIYEGSFTAKLGNTLTVTRELSILLLEGNTLSAAQESALSSVLTELPRLSVVSGLSTSSALTRQLAQQAADNQQRQQLTQFAPYMSQLSLVIHCLLNRDIMRLYVASDNSEVDVESTPDLTPVSPGAVRRAPSAVPGVGVTSATLSTVSSGTRTSRARTLSFAGSIASSTTGGQREEWDECPQLAFFYDLLGRLLPTFPSEVMRALSHAQSLECPAPKEGFNIAQYDLKQFIEVEARLLAQVGVFAAVETEDSNKETQVMLFLTKLLTLVASLAGQTQTKTPITEEMALARLRTASVFEDIAPLPDRPDRTPKKKTVKPKESTSPASMRTNRRRSNSGVSRFGAALRRGGSMIWRLGKKKPDESETSVKPDNTKKSSDNSYRN